MDTENLEFEFKDNQLHLKHKGELVPFKNYAVALWNVLTNHHTNNCDCAEEFHRLMKELIRAAFPYGRQGVRIIGEINRIVAEHLQFIGKMIDKVSRAKDKIGLIEVGKHKIFTTCRDTDTGEILCLNCGAPPAPEKKLLKCSKCYLARYCGATCQKEHWKKKHKQECFK